jgi:hypothetical protein
LVWQLRVESGGGGGEGEQATGKHRGDCITRRGGVSGGW